MQGYITIAEFARREGVSRQAVHKWLRRLEMRPYRIAGLSLLSEGDCQQLRSSRRKIGRPQKIVDSGKPAA